MNDAIALAKKENTEVAIYFDEQGTLIFDKLDIVQGKGYRIHSIYSKYTNG